MTDDQAQLDTSPSAADEAAPSIDPATAAYRPFISRGGDELSALAGLAVSHAHRQQWAEAESYLLKVLDKVPASATARAYLASVQAELGKLDEAKASIQTALQAAPGNALVLLKQGELLLKQGLPAEATAVLQRAATLPTPDETTRDYILSLLAGPSATQAAVSTANAANAANMAGAAKAASSDASTPAQPTAPASFWRGLFARFRGSRAPSVGTSAQ